MRFGKKIKQLRKNKKMTQRELAAEVNLAYSYISKIENDRLDYSPSFKTILTLAEALEVDELELLELADKVPAILEPITSDKHALHFFRRASEIIKAREGSGNTCTATCSITTAARIARERQHV